ncbi:mechanosensitive ion channel family protein [Marinihelvus fidelis]|uniref:Mechanosensitive ion channel family protein n=1 Tax=Marinihelvus fidelis TaxID=2613842 RepID=A0A5N0TGK8_9GAMM|nr:mechanosensitive ion channel family protein [Marinihelvus fidelis]KAA9134190.1 mechanosensitive ion channel family protein [Marinihelvus fidelis]
MQEQSESTSAVTGFFDRSVEFFQRHGHEDWLLAAGVAVATWLVLRGILWVLNRYLSRVADKTSTRWDDNFVAALKKTRFWFLVIIATWTGSLTMALAEGPRSVINTLLVLALIIQGGFWINSMLKAEVKRHRAYARENNPGSVSTISMVGFVVQLVLWSTVVLLLLDNLGVDITALVAGLGIGGVAVALAVQNILGDLFASLSIVIDKPFVVDDFLVVGDFLGSVEHIGLKTTRLRSLSGEQLVFSNNDLLTSRIRNYGRMAERRVVFSLGVTYQTPIEKLKLIPNIVREAVEAEDNTRFDRSHFMKYADFSLNYESVFYVGSPDYNIYMDIQQAIFFRIHERFAEEGIEFAYPTQTLYVSREDGEREGDQSAS